MREPRSQRNEPGLGWGPVHSPWDAASRRGRIGKGSTPDLETPMLDAPRRRRERGVSLSAFVATIVTALLLMGGLVIDGGAQSTAARECQQVAAEAARAASDATAPQRAAGVAVDAGVALAAARSVIAGHPALTGAASVSGGVVTVRTEKTARTIFLSLIGIRALSARGEATAALLGTGD